jgi:hypothetical protein
MAEDAARRSEDIASTMPYLIPFLAICLLGALATCILLMQ